MCAWYCGVPVSMGRFPLNRENHLNLRPGQTQVARHWILEARLAGGWGSKTRAAATVKASGGSPYSLGFRPKSRFFSRVCNKPGGSTLYMGRKEGGSCQMEPEIAAFQRTPPNVSGTPNIAPSASLAGLAWPFGRQHAADASRKPRRRFHEWSITRARLCSEVSPGCKLLAASSRCESKTRRREFISITLSPPSC